ncbi:hypothetical protein EDB84DRAFT_1443867 [Lactarius hengduanensis]|nr:hypothetical protein EDB84DRAFT_1443867 [Lactarius hengduanensis]
MTSRKGPRPQDQLRQDYQFGEFLRANGIETRPLGAFQDSERRRRLTDSEGHSTQRLRKQKSALREPEPGPSNSVNNLARTGSFPPTPSDPADFDENLKVLNCLNWPIKAPQTVKRDRGGGCGEGEYVNGEGMWGWGTWWEMWGWGTWWEMWGWGTWGGGRGTWEHGEGGGRHEELE